MSERVIDAFEMVEIEVEKSKLVAAMDAGERLAEPLVEQHAVGQVGERIVPRHVRDLDLGAPALGDVLMGRDPSAIGHGMIQDRDRATVGSSTRRLTARPCANVLRR